MKMINTQISEIRTEGNLEFKTKYPSIYSILTSENIDGQVIETILTSVKKKNLTKKEAGKLFGEMIKTEYECINELEKLQIVRSSSSVA